MVVNVALACICGLLLFIVGCSPHKVIQREMCSSNLTCIHDELVDEYELTTIKEQEAKLIDIPIPLNVEPIPFYFKDASKLEDDATLGYESRMSRDDLILFYTQEMERFGWKKRVTVDSVETLFYFEKPGRYCVVSLRPQPERNKKSNILIIIFVGKR